MLRQEPAVWRRTDFDERLAQQPGCRTEAQVDGAQRFLALEPRARVLDLACGLGRQTLELARRGYRVLGLDLHDAPLAEARRTAREERLTAHFLKTDLRQIPYRSEFDAAVSLGAAICYLSDDRDHLKVLHGARKALKSGGKLLLDMLNKEWLMRHFASGFREPGEGVRVAFDFETGRLAIAGREGERGPAAASLRVYTLTEIKALLARAGFVYGRVWGGYAGEPYGMDCARMIVLAGKPADELQRRRRAEPLAAAIRIKGRRKGG